MSCDEVFPDIKIEGDEKKHEGDSQDKELHHPGVYPLWVLSPGLFEEEGLRTQAEGLDKKGDEQGQLIIGAVNSNLEVRGIPGGRVYPPTEHYPVKGFVDHPPEIVDGDGE